jgi:hypothetical protein
MRSPLARVILALLGGYVAIMIGLAAYNWLREYYPIRPDAPPLTVGIQHPFHHKTALKAIERYSQLPKARQDAVKANLQSQLSDMGKWLHGLENLGVKIICLGELHEEPTRDFLAREFFAKFGVNRLLLEATPDELETIITRLESGRDYFPLLDADILKLLRAVKRKNPRAEVRGIEQASGQLKLKSGEWNPRDQAIARNFWANYKPGESHVVLFGALHCADEPSWLFSRLCKRAPAGLRKQMLNVQVVGEHQNGVIEAFVHFLDQIGIPKGHFVIANTNALHPLIYEWFEDLTRQSLRKYQALIVFRD